MFVKSIPWTRVKCGGCRGWKPIPGLLLCGIATSQRPNKGFVTTYTNNLVCSMYIYLFALKGVRSFRLPFLAIVLWCFLKLSFFVLSVYFFFLFCTPLPCVWHWPLLSWGLWHWFFFLFFFLHFHFDFLHFHFHFFAAHIVVTLTFHLHLAGHRHKKSSQGFSRRLDCSIFTQTSQEEGL